MENRKTFEARLAALIAKRAARAQAFRDANALEALRLAFGRA